MPQPLWMHACTGGASLIETAECAACGSTGTFHGWHLTIPEEHARYEYVYGVRGGGAHRTLADALFRGMRRWCSRCNGRAILTLDGGAGWRQCPTCEGTGGVWTFPDDDVEAVRRAILNRFPDAALPETPRCIVSPEGAYDHD